MASFPSITVSADTAGTYLCDIQKNRTNYIWVANVYVSGTFGGGAVTFGSSIDNGTTIIPLRNASGSILTITSNDIAPINLVGGNKNNDAPKLYIILTGATGPSLSVKVYNNND